MFGRFFKILLLLGLMLTTARLTAREWFVPSLNTEQKPSDFQIYPDDRDFFAAHRFLGNDIQLIQQAVLPVSDYQSYYLQLIEQTSQQHLSQINALMRNHRPNLALARHGLSFDNLHWLQYEIESKRQMSPNIEKHIKLVKSQYHAVGRQIQDVLLGGAYIQKIVASINQILLSLREFADDPYFYHAENLSAFAQSLDLATPFLSETCRENSLPYCVVEASIPSNPKKRLRLEEELSRAWRHLAALKTHLQAVLNHQPLKKGMKMNQISKPNSYLGYGDYGKYSYHDFLITAFHKFEQGFSQDESIEAAIAAGSMTEYYRQHPLLHKVESLQDASPVFPALEYYAHEPGLQMKLCDEVDWYATRLQDLDDRLAELRRVFADIMQQYKADLDPALLRQAAEIISRMQDIVKQKNELGYIDYVANDRKIELHWELSSIMPAILPAAKQSSPWQFYDLEIVYVQLGDSFWSIGMPFKITEILPQIAEIRLEKLLLTGQDSVVANQSSHLSLQFLQSPYTACGPKQTLKLIVQLRSEREYHHLVLAR
ncbi:MAG: hypothetical protein ACOH5I_06600 [Oligoflexus sp.]